MAGNTPQEFDFERAFEELTKIGAEVATNTEAIQGLMSKADMEAELKIQEDKISGVEAQIRNLSLRLVSEDTIKSLLHEELSQLASKAQINAMLEAQRTTIQSDVNATKTHITEAIEKMRKTRMSRRD